MSVCLIVADKSRDGVAEAFDRAFLGLAFAARAIAAIAIAAAPATIAAEAFLALAALFARSALLRRLGESGLLGAFGTLLALLPFGAILPFRPVAAILAIAAIGLAIVAEAAILAITPALIAILAAVLAVLINRLRVDVFAAFGALACFTSGGAGFSLFAALFLVVIEILAEALGFVDRHLRLHRAQHAEIMLGVLGVAFGHNPSRMLP